MKYSWGKIVVLKFFSIVENEEETSVMFDAAEFLVAIGKQIIINNCWL